MKILPSITAGWILLVASSAFADGKVFTQVKEVATIPDQEAVISWLGGVQTLAIQTHFSGAGQDFAWVVPTPGVPEIEPVTTGTFTTLRTFFGPRIIHEIPVLVHYLILVVVIGLLLHTRRNRTALAVLVLSLLIMSIFLPSLAQSRGNFVSTPADAQDAIRIHSQQRIGQYEATVVSSERPDAMLDWLNEHGFHATPAAQTVIRDYVRQGWCFAVMKLRRDVAHDPLSAPHPLAFHFRTDHPVYPLRLTQVENGRLKVHLYVFGPQFAEAPGFRVMHSARLVDQDTERDDVLRLSPESIPIVHPGLRQLAAGSACGTFLVADLEPQSTVQDALIQWNSKGPWQAKYFSRKGAMLLIINVMTGVACLSLLIGTWLRRKQLNGRMPGPRIYLVSIALGLLVALAYALLPVKEVKFSSILRDRFLDYSARKIVHYMLETEQIYKIHPCRSMYFNLQKHLEVPLNALSGGCFALYSNVSNFIGRGGVGIAYQAEAEAWLRQYITLEPDGVTPADWRRIGNQGELRREEDSPNNYRIVSEPDGRVMFYWYNYLGRELPVQVWPELKYSQEFLDNLRQP